MTRFRMISRCGEGLALLRQIQAEGCECDFWCPGNVPLSLYQGMIGRVDNWKENLDDDVTVIFDSPGNGQVISYANSSWGAGTLNDVFHFDRSFGLRIAKIYSLKIPQWHYFNDIASALEFLNMKDKDADKKEIRWNLELAGRGVHYENQACRDMIDLLEISQASGGLFLIEEIEGQSITCQAFYVKGNLVENSIFSSIERSKFLAGNYGFTCQPPNVLGWFWKPKKKREGFAKPTIYRHTLKKIEPFLQQHEYTGPLCVKLKISKSDGIPCFYGFETGLRYPAIYAMLEGVENNVSDIIIAMAQGELPELKVSHDYFGSIALSVPPYPYFPGRFGDFIRIDLENEHIRPLDISIKDNKCFTAGAHGIVAHVTTKNKSVDILEKELYVLCETIKVADKQIRCDGFGQSDTIELLKNWNYF